MADKIPWCKFWHSCLSDPDLEELELHNWARWARLIIFVRGHGDIGKMRLEPPARALQTVLRISSYDELIKVLKLFKNVTLTPLSQEQSLEASHDTSHGYFVIVKNWRKYQGDSSKKRTRKWRDKKTVTKHVSGDSLDKSRLDVTSTSTSSAARPAPGGASATRELPVVKSYEEAGENDLCGPPKNMWEKIKKDMK